MIVNVFACFSIVILILVIEIVFAVLSCCQTCFVVLLFGLFWPTRCRDPESFSINLWTLAAHTPKTLVGLFQILCFPSKLL